MSLETDLGGMPANEIEEKRIEVKKLLLDQAYKLADLGENVVVKIPVCSGGLDAIKELSKKGIKTNVTACMTPYQALAAAKAGATYVSIFANRSLDCHIISMSGHELDYITSGKDWKKVAKKFKDKYFEKAWHRVLAQIAYVAQELDNNYKGTELIIGSIRGIEDVYRLVKCKPHILTLPTGIVQKLVKGHIPIKELKEFERTFDEEEVVMGNSITHPMTTFTLDEFERAADSYR